MTSKDRRPHRARCDVCGVILQSDHAWHVSTCECGRLSLSGGPDLRRVSWRADPGASWTDLSDEAGSDEAGSDEAGSDEAGSDETGSDEAYPAENPPGDMPSGH